MTTVTLDACRFEGCEYPIYTKKSGYCEPHYQQYRKGGHFAVTPRFDAGKAMRPIVLCWFHMCGRLVYGNGLCNGHYQQSRRYAGTDKPMTPIHVALADRICTVPGCGRILASGVHCQAHHKMARQGLELVEIRRRRMQKGRYCSIPGCETACLSGDTCAVHRHAGKYNLTPEQIARLFTDPKCHICGGQNPSGRGFHIDHDHSCCPVGGTSCGKCVRGLLCSACNHGIGFLKDDVEVLLKAIAYLRGERPFSP